MTTEIPGQMELAPEPLTDREVRQITQIMEHVAGILAALPLERYELAMRERMVSGRPDLSSRDEAREARYRRSCALHKAARASGALADAVDLAERERAGNVVRLDERRPSGLTPGGGCRGGA